MGRFDRTKSISLSPAEREGDYARNPGEIATGNDIELRHEFDRVKKSFVELPEELVYLPRMNPCGNESSDPLSVSFPL